MEPPLKRQRADSTDTVPSHPATTASNADLLPIAEPPAPINSDFIRTMINTLDEGAMDMPFATTSFSHRTLLKIAKSDATIAATIQEAYDAYMEKERNTSADFKKVLDDFKWTIPGVRGCADDAVPPEEIPVLSSQIKDAFYRSVAEICGRTHDYSSLGTKKNALDALRKLGVMLVNTPDKKLRAAVADRIKDVESQEYVNGMYQIARHINVDQREEVCMMPVNESMDFLARLRDEESVEPTGQFQEKLEELQKELNNAGFPIRFSIVHQELDVTPQTIQDDIDNGVEDNGTPEPDDYSE